MERLDNEDPWQDTDSDTTSEDNDEPPIARISVQGIQGKLVLQLHTFFNTVVCV